MNLTPEQQQSREEYLEHKYLETGYKKGLVEVVGGSVEDWGQETGYDAGEPPQGAEPEYV